MYALIYKDFLLLKKQLLYVLVLAVFYTVIAVSGFLSASILPGMVVLFATMLPITSFSYDEQARWGQYAAATPAGRRGVVAAKYLFSLLLLLLGLLLVSALITLLVGLGLLREPLPTALYAVLCCGSVALGIDAVLLPVLLKHGAEKGRFAIMAVCIAVVGGGMLLWQLHRGGLRLPQAPARAAVARLALLAAAAFAVSYGIARHIYERKEL